MPSVDFVHQGEAVDFSPETDLTAGSVVVRGELVGVTKHDIKSGKLGAIFVEGVFDFPKATGTGTAITLGANCYWDNTNQRATTTSSGNKLIGKSVKATTDSEAVVRIKLLQ
jgi:predicted RecA/RadA family phage recombinase